MHFKDFKINMKNSLFLLLKLNIWEVLYTMNSVFTSFSYRSWKITTRFVYADNTLTARFTQVERLLFSGVSIHSAYAKGKVQECRVMPWLDLSLVTLWLYIKRQTDALFSRNL